jgi:hypothetical protein
MGSTQPREYNWGAACKKKKRLRSRKPRVRPRDPSRVSCGTLYPQKLSLTWPTSCCLSFGLVRSQTQATEFSLAFLVYFIPSVPCEHLAKPWPFWKQGKAKELRCIWVNSCAMLITFLLSITQALQISGTSAKGSQIYLIIELLGATFWNNLDQTKKIFYRKAD